MVIPLQGPQDGQDHFAQPQPERSPRDPAHPDGLEVVATGRADHERQEETVELRARGLLSTFSATSAARLEAMGAGEQLDAAPSVLEGVTEMVGGLCSFLGDVFSEHAVRNLGGTVRHRSAIRLHELRSESRERILVLQWQSRTRHAKQLAREIVVKTSQHPPVPNNVKIV
jgi:hypothetical protein